MLYKTNFGKLKEVKAEIEHIQRLLDQSRTRLQKDFEQWYTVMLRDGGGGQGGTASAQTGAVANGQQQQPCMHSAATPPPAQRQQQTLQQQAVQLGGKMVQLTGNKDVDDEMLAFQRAREEHMRQQGPR